MVKIEQKENTLAAIELVVKEFLSEDAIGKWFSVKERSLGNLIKEVGLDIRYSTAIYEELKNIGMIEKEGIKAQSRYKIITDVIPDARGLSEKIYRNNCDRRNQFKQNYLETRNGDLTPFRPKKGISINDLEEKQCKHNKVVIKKEFQRIPRLGEIVYALVNGFITEAKIICVRFNEEDKVLVSFTTPIITQGEDGQTTNVKRPIGACVA